MQGKLFFRQSFCALVALMFTLSLTAQVYHDDSFRIALNRVASDTGRINKMLQLSQYIKEQSAGDSTCIYWAGKAEQQSTEINYHTGASKAALILGWYYFDVTEWEHSIQAFQRALSYAGKIADRQEQHDLMFDGWVNLAEVYNYIGDYVTALDYRLQALHLIDSISTDDDKYTGAYVSVANDFRHLNQRSKAIEYLEKVGPHLDQAKPSTKLDFYYEYYQNLLLDGQLKKSEALLARFDSGVAHFNLTPAQIPEFSGMSHKLHGQYALNYSKDFPAALMHFKKYLLYSEQMGNRTHIAIAYNKIGIAYDSLRQYPEAIQAFKESYDICMKDKIIDYGYKSAYELSLIYEKMKDFPNAYRYAINAYNLKDTLASADKLRELNFLEAKYQSARKEKEITGLKLSNTERELGLVKRNRLLVIGGICAASLLLLLFLLFRNSRHKMALANQQKMLQDEKILFLERQQQVLSLQSMVNGQESERTRIAKDLHDGLGGLFSTIKMYFSTLEHQQPQLEKDALFRKSIDMVDNAATEVRRIAHNMMPAVLMKMGLMNALQDLCNNISSAGSLHVTLQQTGMVKRLHIDTEIMLYRIIQELLNNIIKHAHAKHAIVQCILDGNRLSVIVEDDGCGFDIESLHASHHAGMETVKSRVNYLNGKLNIDSRKDVGTTVMMDFMLDET